jgi:hypothetical protein
MKVFLFLLFSGIARVMAQSGSADTLVPIRGTWLNEKYLAALMKTRSPRESQDAAERSCLYIPSAYTDKAMFVYGFHEGGEDMHVVRKGHGFALVSDYSRAVLPLRLLSGTRLVVERDTFVRLKQPWHRHESPRVLEEVLFSGTYFSGGRKVIFSADGTVTGLGAFREYFPFPDYRDAGMQVDQLHLIKSESDIKTFGFRFQGDTLNIYELDCLQRDEVNVGCVEVKFGKLKYRLEKQR